MQILLFSLKIIFYYKLIPLNLFNAYWHDFRKDI